MSDLLRLGEVLAASSILGDMRATDFWQRMRTVLGAAYAESFARDHVIQSLGGRTVREALAAGVSVQEVWRAVCQSGAVEVPPHLR